MSILIDRNTKVIVQGITGREGSFHAERMLEYGTRVAGGVTPGKGGNEILGLPVFDKVRDAVSRTGAEASVIFVPSRFAYDAIIEAADGGIRLIVCITEGIPVQDMLKAVAYTRDKGVRLLGPNGPGMAVPGTGKLGIIPNSILKPGPVAVLSRSGTLTYEIIHNLSEAGIGQSVAIGVGGDPILGTRFQDLLPLVEEDETTAAVVLIGEIGGSDEEQAAGIMERMKKPVIGFISGRTAPPGKRMGHAGAIVSGNSGTVESKEKALKAAKVTLAAGVGEITGLVRDVLKNQSGLKTSPAGKGK